MRQKNEQENFYLSMVVFSSAEKVFKGHSYMPKTFLGPVLVIVFEYVFPLVIILAQPLKLLTEEG